MTIVAIQPAEPLTGLASYREDLGLSQRQAARVTGISRRRLQQLEAEPAFTEAAVRIALVYVALRVLAGAEPLLSSNGSEAA